MNSPEKENPTFNGHDNNATDAFGVKSDRESISGWLVVFLYLGIGLFSIISLLYVIVNAYECDLGLSPLTFLMLTPGIIFCATGAFTIIAFHKRQPNAVSLAKTYMVMIALSGIFGAIASVIIGESFSVEGFIGILRQFMLAGGGYAYLSISQQVETIIPSETRISDNLEKYLLAGFIASEFFLLVACPFI